MALIPTAARILFSFFGMESDWLPSNRGPCHAVHDFNDPKINIIVTDWSIGRSVTFMIRTSRRRLAIVSLRAFGLEFFRILLSRTGL